MFGIEIANAAFLPAAMIAALEADWGTNTP